ncbi:MAG: hypothetical protein H6978_00970 [Gammaproteobacteria bacterium]|nr:hypothetical protein [Gammaproteobacteria bacterium]
MATHRFVRLHGLLGAVLFTCSALPAIAVPDLSGYWMISYNRQPPAREATAEEQALLDLLPPTAVLLEDSGLFEFPPGVYGGLAVHAAIAEAARDYDPEVQRSVSTTCVPPAIDYGMQGPFPLEIFQGQDMVVIKMEYFDQVRIVFMNSEHPADWPHSTTGHSIGHWEGDDLVVDTTFLKSSTLFNNGVEHSEDFHLVERFRLSKNGNTLFITQLFDDPAIFDGMGARLIPLNREEGHVYPYECDPTYGIAVENRQRRE